MMILDLPTRGDVTIILTQHLIAAEFNIMGGKIGGLQEAIDDADAYLMAHPLYSKPSGANKKEGGDIKDFLVGYNEMGCVGTSAGALGSIRFNSAPSSGDDEDTSWGAIKKAGK